MSKKCECKKRCNCLNSCNCGSGCQCNRYNHGSNTAWARARAGLFDPRQFGQVWAEPSDNPLIPYVFGKSARETEKTWLRPVPSKTLDPRTYTSQYPEVPYTDQWYDTKWYRDQIYNKELNTNSLGSFPLGENGSDLSAKTKSLFNGFFDRVESESDFGTSLFINDSLVDSVYCLQKRGKDGIEVRESFSGLQSFEDRGIKSLIEFSNNKLLSKQAFAFVPSADSSLLMIRLGGPEIVDLWSPNNSVEIENEDSKVLSPEHDYIQSIELGVIRTQEKAGFNSQSRFKLSTSLQEKGKLELGYIYPIALNESGILSFNRNTKRYEPLDNSESIKNLFNYIFVKILNSSSSINSEKKLCEELVNELKSGDLVKSTRIVLSGLIAIVKRINSDFINSVVNKSLFYDNSFKRNIALDFSSFAYFSFWDSLISITGTAGQDILVGNIGNLTRGLNRIASEDSTENLFTIGVESVSTELMQESITKIMNGLYYLTGFESQHSQNAEIVLLNERIEEINSQNDARIEAINSENEKKISEIKSNFENQVLDLNKKNSELNKKLDKEQHGIGSKLIKANIIFGSVIGGYNAYRYADGKDGISNNEKWITTGIGAILGAIPIVNILSISMTDKIVGSFVENEQVRSSAMRARDFSKAKLSEATEFAKSRLGQNQNTVLESES